MEDTALLNHDLGRHPALTHPLAGWCRFKPIATTAHALRLWVDVIHMIAFRPRRHHPSLSVMIGHVSELSELITTHAP